MFSLSFSISHAQQNVVCDGGIYDLLLNGGKGGM